MAVTFKKAERKKAKLRLELTGPSGSGKSLGALLIAKGLGGRIAVIDTEHESASLYAEPLKLPNGQVFTPPEFDTLSLSAPYTPEKYIEAIKAAEQAGYNILIIDSMTHEWNGSGGCLEINDNLAASKYRGNSFTAWNETTPRHRAFVDAILASKCHIIGTARSKTETAQTEGANGKKQVVKLGMKAEQRDGLEYEFTTVLDIVHAGHFAMASKDRTGLFTGDPAPITEETGKRLAAWLESGAEVVEGNPLMAATAIEGLNATKDTADLELFWRSNYAALKAALSDDQMASVTKVKDEKKAEHQPKEAA